MAARSGGPQLCRGGTPSPPDNRCRWIPLPQRIYRVSSTSPLEVPAREQVLLPCSERDPDVNRGMVEQPLVLLPLRAGSAIPAYSRGVTAFQRQPPLRALTAGPWTWQRGAASEASAGSGGCCPHLPAKGGRTTAGFPPFCRSLRGLRGRRRPARGPASCLAARKGPGASPSARLPKLAVTNY